MSVAQIVIVGAESDRCCSATCRRFAEIVQASFAPRSVRVTSVRRVGSAACAHDPDLAVLRMPSHQAFAEVLDPLRAAWPNAPLLGATCGTTPEARELEAYLGRGLDDFLCCPVAELDLVVRLRKLVPEHRPLREERASLVRDLQLDMLVGESRTFLEAARRIPLAARSTATVLVTGETGAGKGLFAHAVHYNGPRRNRPFISANCSALPDQLFENELFGHMRGAYTDASSAESGLLAEAEGGTIFLDEVDTLAPSGQAKLLRFVQDREYRPLGSSKTRVADVRVIAATNADLPAMVAARQFRKDLFHRLNVLPLTVPPLRERPSDIPILATHFLARFAAECHRPAPRLSSATVRKLLSYSWPGNVRELEALLTRAVVYTSSEVLEAEAIELPASADDGARHSSLRGARGEAVQNFERGYVSDLLGQHDGNVSRAARAAGADRRTFQRILRKYGIVASDFRARCEPRAGVAAPPCDFR